MLGRNITARIANLRSVDWQSLGINFVLVFSPNAFRGAPHTHIATLTISSRRHRGAGCRDPQGRGDAFPAVTTVRVKDALEAVGSVVYQSRTRRFAAPARHPDLGVLVLGGALAASHHNRVYDAIILKTLGATRSRLLGAYVLEYLCSVLPPQYSGWRLVRLPRG